MNKPNCYDCKHKSEIPGDAHIKCDHPTPKDIGIKGHPGGIMGGWFHYPYNFDPCWLLECNGFKEKNK